MSPVGPERRIEVGDAFLFFIHASATLIALVLEFRFLPWYRDSFIYQLPDDAVKVQFLLWTFSLSLFCLGGVNILTAYFYFRKSGQELIDSRKLSRLAYILGSGMLIVCGGHVLAHSDGAAGTSEMGYAGIFLIILALLSGVMILFGSLSFNREEVADIPSTLDAG